MTREVQEWGVVMLWDSCFRRNDKVGGAGMTREGGGRNGEEKLD